MSSRSYISVKIMYQTWFLDVPFLLEKKHNVVMIK